MRIVFHRDYSGRGTRDAFASTTAKDSQQRSLSSGTEESGDLTTHSPHLLANFSSRQLCQIILMKIHILLQKENKY